jgi:hypothetical protein
MSEAVSSVYSIDDLVCAGPEEDERVEVAGSPAVVLEDGVPIPPEGPRHTMAVYPWATMAVGQSFLVPKAMKNPRSLTARAEASHPGRKFVWRRAQETRDGRIVQGVRFWRTA